MLASDLAGASLSVSRCSVLSSCQECQQGNLSNILSLWSNGQSLHIYILTTILFGRTHSEIVDVAGAEQDCVDAECN